MLANAYPLMEIYRSEREKERNAFLLADVKKSGNRRGILTTLPLYTASEELLSRILKDQKERIKQYAAAQRQRVLTILETDGVKEEIPLFTTEEFKKNPPILELSGIFREADIPYNEEEYAAHLAETKAFAKENPHYTLKQTAVHAFRNLQIFIHEGQWVMVSKSKAPTIHFVIRHPKLRGAIENFILFIIPYLFDRSLFSIFRSKKRRNSEIKTAPATGRIRPTVCLTKHKRRYAEKYRGLSALRPSLRSD